MKKDTYYFSHDYNARNDIKTQALLVEHGAAGYGVYWVIVEMLHEETNRKLLLNNLSFVVIARQASTSVEQVKAIVECCLEYELFIEEDGYFFSQRVLVNIDKRMQISEQRAEAGRRSAKSKRKAKSQKSSTSVEQNSTSVEESATSVEENATNAEETATSVQQNSTKERKGKERKVKETKINNNTNTVFNFRKALLDYGFHEELVDEWLTIRKNKRSVNSEFAYNSFIAQVERAGVEKNELLRIIAERQWAGFNIAWLTDNNNNNNNLNKTVTNEADRQSIESAKRKQEILDFARSVGMAGGEENQDSGEIW